MGTSLLPAGSTRSSSSCSSTVSIRTFCSSLSSVYSSSESDPLLLLCDQHCRGRLVETRATHLTSTNSSSPASLLYSGNVLTLLPLSVLLNALPLGPRALPLLLLVLPDALRDRSERDVPASSSAVSETREVARRPSACRSRRLRSQLLDCSLTSA